MEIAKILLMFRTVAKNTIFLSGSQILARLFGFLYFIFLARFLGVEKYGIYIFVLSFIYNFIPVADFGIERFVLRDISRSPEKENQYFYKLFPLRITLSLVAYLIAVASGFFLGLDFEKIIYLMLFGLLLIPQNLLNFWISFQNAKEKMYLMAIANISTILLAGFLGISFVLFKLPFVYLFLTFFLSNSVIMTIFFLKASINDPINLFKIDFEFWLKALKESWPFAVLVILAVFYLRISVIVVGIFKDNFAIGIYGSAYKFIEATILVPQSLALALFPITSKLFSDDLKKLKSIYKKGILALFVFSLPFFIVFGFFPELLIRFALGVNYLPAIPVLRILSLCIVVFFLNSLPGNIIQSSPKVKQFLPFAIFNFLSTLILCLVLIPRYSVIGAAWSVLGGELIGLVINNLFVYKIFKNV